MVTEASAEMLQKLLLSERKIILCWIVVKKINGFILVLRFRREGVKILVSMESKSF